MQPTAWHCWHSHRVVRASQETVSVATKALYDAVKRQTDDDLSVVQATQAWAIKKDAVIKQVENLALATEHIVRMPGRARPRARCCSRSHAL